MGKNRFSHKNERSKTDILHLDRPKTRIFPKPAVFCQYLPYKDHPILCDLYEIIWPAQPGLSDVGLFIAPSLLTICMQS